MKLSERKLCKILMPVLCDTEVYVELLKRNFKITFKKLFLFNFFEDISPFCEATGTRVFEMRVMAALELECFIAYIQGIP